MRKEKASQTEILHEVTAYFHALPKDVRSALKTLRSRVHAALPAGAQGFSYRIPCVRLADRPVVWYAGFKSHVSLYPMTAPVVRAHAAELRGLQMLTGTIRFPLDALPSAALVKKLVNSRLAEMREVLPKKARKARPKTRRTPRPKKKPK